MVSDHIAIATQRMATIQLKRRLSVGTAFAHVQHQAGKGLDHSRGEDLTQLSQVSAALDAGQAFLDAEPEALHQVQADQPGIGVTMLVTNARIWRPACD